VDSVSVLQDFTLTLLSGWGSPLKRLGSSHRLEVKFLLTKMGTINQWFTSFSYLSPLASHPGALLCS